MIFSEDKYYHNLSLLDHLWCARTPWVCNIASHGRFSIATYHIKNPLGGSRSMDMIGDYTALLDPLDGPKISVIR